MKKPLAIAMCALLAPAYAAAQQGSPFGGGNAPFAPNYYNRNSQPLSPYLNLLRGGNPAVNYFYGVRPGLMNGAFASPLTSGFNQLGRQTFFPQVDTLVEPDEATNREPGMRATGHVTGFNSTMSYFGAGSVPAPGSMRSQGQGVGGTGGQQQRPAISPLRGTGGGGIR